MDFSKNLVEVTSVHEALLQISKAINAHLELPYILKQVVHFTCSLVGCDDASIVLWNSRLSQFEMGASTTIIGDQVHYRVRSSGGASRWILDQRQPIIVSDVKQDPFTANSMIRESAVLAYAGVPIQHATDVLGVLYALSLRECTFDNNEIVRMEELAGMVAIAIQNALLVKSLREFNEFKNAMLRMAVHDLNNPLHRAMGYLEILYDQLGSLQPKYLEWLNIIQMSHAQMEELISGILRFEQLSAKSEITRYPIDLNTIAEKAISRFKEAAAQKTQSLTSTLAPGPLIIQGNRALLLEALNNLISNAIKYSPQGGHITIRSEISDGGYAILVQDTGPGIDSADFGKLFIPFVRLNTAENERGTGIGLSLVKLVVEKHGGHVSIQSSLGKGSVFKIYLPSASYYNSES